jgi:AcrR family transcriptional regulator
VTLRYRQYSDTVGIAMATRSRMTRDERKAATRTELLDAARRVFLERGYHGTSLDLVAGEAGYTKGAVYSAFGSKGQMFLAVYEREVDRRWTRIEREVSARAAEGVDPDFGAEGARDFFERFTAERAWTLCLLEFRLHAARDPELNAAYAVAHRRVVERLAGVLAMSSGGDPEDLLDVALAVMALSNGFVLEHLADPVAASERTYMEAGRALAFALLTKSDRRS